MGLVVSKDGSCDIETGIKVKFGSRSIKILEWNIKMGLSLNFIALKLTVEFIIKMTFKVKYYRQEPIFTFITVTVSQ
jgi:hypothetical protein